MDTSNMNPEFLKFDTGIIIGEDTAPLKLIELINVRCPYCKKWHDDNNDLLMELVSKGKLQRSIKLFDKEKPGLNKGNIMHQFVSKSDGPVAIKQLSKLYDTQDIWGDFESSDDISTFAKNELHFEIDHSEELSVTIQQEATAANIPFVPTMVINNYIFDQSISLEDLLDLLDK